MFLQGSSAPQSCWTIIGIGIRLVQDVGAHRRKVYGSSLTAEDELWKRAFWYGRFLRVFSAFKLTYCAGFWWLWIVRQARALDDLVPCKTKSRFYSDKRYDFTRTLTINLDPSFDLDLPAECDDEYWSPPDPKDAFKQPPGKPSKMSYFIAYLKLSQILAFALRTIVSSTASRYPSIY